MADDRFSWAMPLMRAGYAGRGLVYAVVAGVSLYAIWRGGAAQGVSDALQRVEGGAGGGLLLVLIVAGLFAYMAWRLLDAAYDLEDYGSDGKGWAARAGMAVTGLVHGALGVLAFGIAFGGGGGSGGGSRIGGFASSLMSQPWGRWAFGHAGVAVIGAGIYYLHKAWAETYRRHLRANRFTLNWNWALKAGVAAQGATVLIIGGLFVLAAWRVDPSQAGGLGQTFGWLYQQPYGRVLVTLLCLGLLGFAMFCFGNAGYRIVPKVADEDVETLAARLKREAEARG